MPVRKPTQSPRKPLLLREANPGWIAVAIIAALLVVVYAFTPFQLSTDTVIWGAAILIMLGFLFFAMDKYEVVVSPSEVRDKVAANKQAIVVLLIAIFVLAISLLLGIMGVV